MNRVNSRQKATEGILRRDLTNQSCTVLSCPLVLAAVAWVLLEDPWSCQREGCLVLCECPAPSGAATGWSLSFRMSSVQAVNDTANVAANKKAMAFDTAKWRRFSAGCFFFHVFLPRLFSHINEFWPKLWNDVQVLAKAAKKRENVPIFNTFSLCIESD